MIRLFTISLILISATSLKEASVLYDSKRKAITIRGLELKQGAEIGKYVAVYFGEVLNNSALPQVIGSFELVGSTILYKAKYGFSAGESYTVIIRRNDLVGSQIISDANIMRVVIKIPAIKKKSSTFVKNVYPTISKLTMNQLKLYLKFSAPMQMGKAYDHIKLYRMPEKVLESEAFLTMPEELWDPQRKRLTIFFDPGRIKRGVQPNLQLGLPLVEGRSYKLVIDKEWLDINGTRLIDDFEKEIEVTGVDRESPDQNKWKIELPEANTNKALVIDFKEPMDYGLLNSTIVILNEANEQVIGKIMLMDHEKKWLFTPAQSWRPGIYRILINAWLEDLAGNNLNRKFDVDLNDPEDQPQDIDELSIPFKITQHSNQ